MKKLTSYKKHYKRFQEKHSRKIRKVVRKPFFAIPFVTFMAFLAVIAVGFVVSRHTAPELKPTETHLVTLTHDKEEQVVPTRSKTVGELLDKLDIKLNEGDVVEPDASTEIVGDNFRVNVYRAVPLTIVDGDKKIFTYSAAATARSVVKRAGVNVYPEDKIQMLPVDNFLTESSIGERVVITRATPVSMNLYGTPVTIRTHAKTVGDLLKEKNIKLGKDDDVQPVASTTLAANTGVFILRKGTQVVTEEQALSMPSETVEDASLTFGTTALRQAGSPGKKLITYQLELQNGKEVSRKIIQEVVTQAPVAQITARGKAVSIPSDKQAVMSLAGIAPSDYPYADFIISHESGWCPTKMQGQVGYCPGYAPTSFPSGYGYGLCQSTPGTKMASAGADWQTNPVTQLRWCSGYAKKYGGWAGAYDFWQRNHWW